jgi:hypothetical protein
MLEYVPLAANHDSFETGPRLAWRFAERHPLGRAFEQCGQLVIRH